jgi:hypothetical protein
MIVTKFTCKYTTYNYLYVATFICPIMLMKFETVHLYKRREVELLPCPDRGNKKKESRPGGPLPNWTKGTGNRDIHTY